MTKERKISDDELVEIAGGTGGIDLNHGAAGSSRGLTGTGGSGQDLGDGVQLPDPHPDAPETEGTIPGDNPIDLG